MGELNAPGNEPAKQSPFTEDVIESMQTCIEHARDLLTVARLAQDAEKPNIAYHLTALALEELGRRELLALQTIANATTLVPPAWPLKHTQDHEKKMFWAFFGALFRGQEITKDSIEEIRSFAKHIHTRRIAGLYVDTNDGLNVPSEAIPTGESKNLIVLVEARLGMASVEEHRSEASQEDLEMQNWFLDAAADEGKQRFIFSNASMAKLAELGNARTWVEWLKSELDAAQAYARTVLTQELVKSQGAPVPGARPKWKMRIRLFADAHSVRPKAVNWWNERVSWIKLVAVSTHKSQLLVDLIFNDDVPLDRLWLAGWMVARRFIAALNLATRGFWWWHLPRQISRYYDRIDDLENGLEVRMDRNPRLKIDWGSKPVLDEEALRQTMVRFSVLSHLSGSEAESAVEYYLGGLTLLSLNEVHWQCEVHAYGNFHQALKSLMKSYGAWDGKEPFQNAFSRSLKSVAPDMPVDQHDHFVAIARGYEAGAPETVSVDLSDTAFIKVLCDNYFATAVAPVVFAQIEVQEKPE